MAVAKSTQSAKPQKLHSTTFHLIACVNDFRRVRFCLNPWQAQSICQLQPFPHRYRFDHHRCWNMRYKEASCSYKLSINVSENSSCHPCLSIFIKGNINIQFNIWWLRFSQSLSFVPCTIFRNLLCICRNRRMDILHRIIGGTALLWVLLRRIHQRYQYETDITSFRPMLNPSKVLS
jgi:hypothetical protein